MAKAKYYYGIVNKENGTMLLEDGKLPFYWNRKIAKERCAGFSKYCVVRLDLETINNLILKSERV